MIKILTLFALILLFGCQQTSSISNKISFINCPKVFFSKENNVYLTGDLQSLNLDQIEFKSVLNNYLFPDKCYSDSTISYYTLQLLTLVEPISPKNQNINLPIFAILYDKNDKIIDKQFFRSIDIINFNNLTSDRKKIDLIIELKIKSINDRVVDSITIGFVNIDK